MATTHYFDEQVLRKRPYISLKQCHAVIADSLKREVHEDGRIRFWGSVVLAGEPTQRVLRVVTLKTA